MQALPLKRRPAVGLAHILGISPMLLNDIECGQADMPDTVDLRRLEAL
jgi:hypothetical protein